MYARYEEHGSSVRNAKCVLTESEQQRAFATAGTLRTRTRF